MPDFGYAVSHTNGRARRGRLTTAHGTVETPVFMPVGTAATVKGMTSGAVARTGAEIVLANTYHLMLRPGAERVGKLGGLHEFMDWKRPILTDSGGFQVMSLTDLRKLDDKGVEFRSHIDGAKFMLTPERSVEIQHLLDSTITMVLDECTAHGVDEASAADSMRLSMRWADRCREAFERRPGYGLFGIVQGSVFPDLRIESAAALTDIGFDGYAVGGLAVGEGQDEMFSVLDVTVPALPESHPRYLMGVGTPADIVGAVQRGIDMFDCVLPTRSGRTGQAFTRRGPLNIRNARHAEDLRPLDPDSIYPHVGGVSRAYLHHLFKAREMLGPILLTLHNLHYYQELMDGIRGAIEAGQLDGFVSAFHEEQARGDLDPI
ncbi:MAG: tRNA guanosine(34) transglycosylase Tgt [Rhodospirillaceae bacterium TMED63]|nr:tRNA guanosine(34) transglycosylase Tgt [Rhodospirillaceae bacterium]RPF98328.1 MAG: tRNA guanosine(34) transglycosylase Tgt [Rhodospirillaceae bacterium TMED63]